MKTSAFERIPLVCMAACLKWLMLSFSVLVVLGSTVHMLQFSSVFAFSIS